MLTAAAGVKTGDFRLSYHGWGKGAGSRAAFSHIPPCHPCPGWAEWMPEQHMAPCTSPKCCLQQEGTCHILGTHSHRNPGAACGQKQWVCFASQPLTIVSLTFNTNPKWLELPQKPLSKYWSFYTGMVFSHTDFSCNFYLTMSKVTQKQEWGKGISFVPEHFRRQPSPVLSRSWFKHLATWCKLQSLHKDLCHKLVWFRFYLRKLFCCDMTYARPVIIPQSAFFLMSALVQLPTCWQGCCSMSQIKELTMVSIATQQKFPQNSAFVILSFLCTQCEAGLKKHKGYITQQCGSCDSVPDCFARWSSIMQIQ